MKINEIITNFITYSSINKENDKIAQNIAFKQVLLNYLSEKLKSNDGDAKN